MSEPRMKKNIFVDINLKISQYSWKLCLPFSEMNPSCCVLISTDFLVCFTTLSQSKNSKRWSITKNYLVFFVISRENKSCFFFSFKIIAVIGSDFVWALSKYSKPHNLVGLLIPWVLTISWVFMQPQDRKS